MLKRDFSHARSAREHPLSQSTQDKISRLSVILQYKKTDTRPENSNNPITEKKLLSSRILEQINARCLKPVNTSLGIKIEGKEESKDNSVSMFRVSYPLTAKSKTTKIKTSFVTKTALKSILPTKE